jgi:uncharacterized protein (DUF433 family)
MLELLASGMANGEILADYPYMESEDIHSCLIFASKIANYKGVSHYSAP